MGCFPRRAQTLRLISRMFISTFLVSLALLVGVNFQFSGICFDLLECLVTGALIQLVVARILIPFVIGNAFCSRVCWDGAVFELFENSSSKYKCAPIRKYPFRYPSWILMLLIILATGTLLFLGFPNGLTPKFRKLLFVIENTLILLLSFPLTRLLGKRAYCRIFCPLLSVSSLFSRFSLFKITPVNPSACISCGKCDDACPMSIPVSSRVRENKRISDADCMLCERCVSACPNDCIEVSLPLRNNSSSEHDS